jgi:PEP-CTERM motif
VFNSALSAGEVARETEDPFAATTTPEPASWLLMLGGAACLATRKLRRA